MDRKTLLLVDDAPENLDVLKGLLSADYIPNHSNRKLF